VLQGKYNSEVPRFAEQVKELKNRLDSLESENQQLKAKPPETLVTPEDVEQYGDGLIDVARRIAQEELAKKQTEIDSLKSQLSQVQETTANNLQRDFFKSLTEMAPDWKQVNEDPSFLKWLDEVDEFTGVPRQELLSRAEKSRDAVRVAKFFTSFQKTSSTWAANSNSALENQVVPPTNKAPKHTTGQKDLDTR
jgi:DNA repair exonuclease SbcCD ATPase subunit